jgi:hypothetical protein
MATTLEDLVHIAQSAHYNDERKALYKKHAIKFVRTVAKALGLAKGTYDARFNAGGIAVSGDAILHTDDFYVHINDFGVYWRKCHGRKDYTGEHNRQFTSLNLTAGQVAREITVAF